MVTNRATEANIGQRLWCGTKYALGSRAAWAWAMVGLPFDPAVSVSGCRARADGRTRRCLELRGQLVVLDERVGQGNGMDVLGHVRRDAEAHPPAARPDGGEDRKSGGVGKSVSDRVDHGGRL